MQRVSREADCCRCSVVQSCRALCDPTDCSRPGLSVPHHLPEFAHVHVHCIADAVQPSHPLTLSSHLILWLSLLLPSIFSSIRDFSNELSVCIRLPKYWSFSFSISPSSEYSRLISRKIDWFDLLAVQGTFTSLWTQKVSLHRSSSLKLLH